MSKYTGRGGVFSIGTSGATPTYTPVAQVSSIGSIAISADETEVTTLDNVSGFKEFLQTFKDSGELPIGLIWDPDLPTHGNTADGLWGLFVSGETRPFQIEFPTKPVAYVADFNGFVKTFPTPQLTPADALTAEVSIRVSGTVDLKKKPNTAPAGSTATIDPTSQGQSAAVSAAFTNPLKVTVHDPANAPFVGAAVTFAAPASGAGAVLATPHVLTDASGVAQTAATANATAGTYDVTATVSGVTGTSAFHLTNT